ncbi:nectin-1-like [Cheilinus undulatus]|uniref:nectin-1-like n=1 Tax=Cheilinus undulatus TaxID=241271 RepID=UPI001BD255FE|nr:nectin-1-like [Cheilinus undulatus]
MGKPTRSTAMYLTVLTVIASTVTNAHHIFGGSTTTVHGGTAVLPCNLSDTTDTLTQISWQRVTRGKPQNDNFFSVSSTKRGHFVSGRDSRFKFIGNFADKNGSLQLSNVKLNDEGTYTCIFILFPSGNLKTEIRLNILVPPVTNLKGFNLSSSNEEVSLVTCTAACSKPPAEVRWLTGSLGEKVRVTTDSTLHDNGTTSTVSSLVGVPSSDIRHHSVQCVINSSALKRGKTLSFVIEVAGSAHPQRPSIIFLFSATFMMFGCNF